MNRADYEELTQQQQRSRDRLLRLAEEHPEHFLHQSNELFRIVLDNERLEDFGKNMTIKQLIAQNTDVFKSSLQKSDTVTEAIDQHEAFQQNQDKSKAEGDGSAKEKRRIRDRCSKMTLERMYSKSILRCTAL